MIIQLTVSLQILFRSCHNRAGRKKRLFELKNLLFEKNNILELNLEVRLMCCEQKVKIILWHELGLVYCKKSFYK